MRPLIGARMRAYSRLSLARAMSVCARRDVRLGLADIGDGDVELRLRGSAGRRQHFHALGVLPFLVQHRGRLSKAASAASTSISKGLASSS